MKINKHEVFNTYLLHKIQQLESQVAELISKQSDDQDSQESSIGGRGVYGIDGQNFIPMQLVLGSWVSNVTTREYMHNIVTLLTLGQQQSTAPLFVNDQNKLYVVRWTSDSGYFLTEINETDNPTLYDNPSQFPLSMDDYNDLVSSGAIPDYCIYNVTK